MQPDSRPPSQPEQRNDTVAEELNLRLRFSSSEWPTVNGHNANQIPLNSADGPIIVEFLEFAVEFNYCLRATMGNSRESKPLTEKDRQELLNLLSKKETLNKRHAVKGIYAECRLDDGRITDLRYSSPTAMQTLIQPTKLPRLRITI